MGGAAGVGGLGWGQGADLFWFGTRRAATITTVLCISVQWFTYGTEFPCKTIILINNSYKAPFSNRS